MQNDIAAAVSAAARSINQVASVEETLQAIVNSARNSVPGFDEVGISTIDKHGPVETRATTGPLVSKLDEIHYGLSEGPCLKTLRRPEVAVVSAPEIRHDQRWPRYVPAALSCGLGAQLAVKLYVDDRGTLGGPNLYSTITDVIDPDAEAVADLFATHAAIALDNARKRETLNEALHSRTMIGQAIGIVMERYEMNEDRASQFLVRASSSSNIELRDIAQELVNERNKS